MIGIVIVSHSAKLADGVVELACGMGGPDLLIQAAGGLDAVGQVLGTDPMAVLAAIEQVYSTDGVLVLMDLGSAVLSAEMALDLLPAEKRARVLLCEAPIVEGAVAAAVQSRLGNSLQQAASEARGALSAKAAHLSSQDDSPPAEQLTLPSVMAEEIELQLTINNPLGVHARPAARLVQAAGRFPQVKIQVTNVTAGRGPANASSINALMTLGIRRGHKVRVTFAGSGANEARAALQALAADNFGDREIPTLSIQKKQSALVAEEAYDLGRLLPGLPISPGIAVGPAHRFQPVLPQVDEHLVSEPQVEWERLLAALAKTRNQIQTNLETAGRQPGRGTASILEAHLLFLDDEALRGPARTAIFASRLNAGSAWKQAIDTAAAGYLSLDDPYLQARAADVEEVGRQVLVNLLGSLDAPLKFKQPGILVATNLSLADAARLDPQVTLGVCLAYGSSSAHSSILVRSLGIPAVGGLGEEVLKTEDGTLLIVDGEHGEVCANPGKDAVEEYTRRSQSRRSARAAELAASASPAITRDGRRIQVAANIASAAEARAAVSSGAEGVGVFRTEFLFLNRAEAPGEDEQYAAYRSAAEGLAGRSLIIRTLDAGGDKPIPYLNLASEANPFLGVRAVRLCLAHPELFKTQLRAILRTAVDFPVKVMYPMIAVVEEWQAAASLLAEARDELRRRGRTAPERIDAGIMVEVPSAALCAARFADEVDFFSIGTNDLVQYTLAAERGNPMLAALADIYHPAVLDLIYRVAEAAHSRGKWAGVCGEMAGDPLAVPVLVGLGIDELSMNSLAIPGIKQAIRFSNYGWLRSRAIELLNLPTAQAVRKAAALLSAAIIYEH